MIKKADQKGVIPEGKKVIHANTPSFVGSHVSGFSNMVKSLVTYLAKHTGEAKDQVNVLPGFVDPADMREYKRLAEALGVKINLFPDTSAVLDIPLTGKYEMYPKGGATMDDITSSGDSIATMACGDWGSFDAARELEKRCEIPWEGLRLPVGLTDTDAFINTLRNLAAVEVPERIEEERGQLVDLMSDMQQYFFNKRVALYGDPDQVIPMTQFLVDLDMKPAYIVTGSLGKRFMEQIHAICAEKNPEVKVAHQQDMFTLHQWIKGEPVDLLIGNTFGKYIARAEGNLPFVRYGFPIMDRVTHRIFPTIGYRGAMRLIDQFVNALLDREDRECEEEWFELVQ
jgi:nitrogenase molybdenum-iron protein beta chain